MEATRILWSGLAGKVGREAVKQVSEVDGVKITGGLGRRPMSFGRVGNLWLAELPDGSELLMHHLDEAPRWYQYGWFSEIPRKKFPAPDTYDVIVDFSHRDVFEQVLDLAAIHGKPLISGTSGLSEEQMEGLLDATKIIPIFRGGNFRFKVKKFIDEAVELAMKTEGRLTLYEEFYEGKSLPSETSKVIRRRIREATNETIGVCSSAKLDKTDWPCDWKIGNLHCHTVGFGELAHDVLEIAKVMAKKPVKQGEFYDLDELWDDLVSFAL